MFDSLTRRRVEAEWLDELAPGDPAAKGSRRDLVRINALMFQAGAMAAMLRRHLQAPPASILDIGAGDGSFMLAVARRMPRGSTPVDLVLLDRADLFSQARREQFEALGWRVETATADVFDWLGRAATRKFDVVAANLFLHHFPDAELSRLFAALKPLAPLLLATEPRRAAFPLLSTRALRLIGANHVTRHDAAASVRAGFSGCELSDLWLATGGQPLEERRRGLFTHVFAASSDAA